MTAEARALGLALLVLAAGLLAACRSGESAQGTPRRLSGWEGIVAWYKERSGFDRWPGKHGKLIEGYRLAWWRYPELAGLQVRAEGCCVYPEERIVRRSVELTGRDGLVVELELCVGMQATDDVHQRLLATFFTWSAGLPPRGSTLGIELGDVCYVSADREGHADVYFVRNNVFVALQRWSDRGQVDLLGLARRIDAELRSLPVADTLEGHPCLPVFWRVEVPSTAQAETLVDYEFQASSSDGGEVTFQVEGTRLTWDQDDRLRLYVPSKSITLRVFAISESNLYSETTHRMTVVK